ncbi:hypothetical protein MLD55_05080 [Alcanivorax sp. MM125-6]|nr:hypothetical protein [Alcanivorax sp. MM125-6]
MTAKQTKKRASKMEKQALQLRGQFWPGLDESELWDRKLQKGFATIPRPMPILYNIMDDLAPKSKPVSSTHFSLWCRVFDQSLVTVESPGELAFEAGFTGQRAVNTWSGRMQSLEQLGFISSRPGASGKFQYILLLNPFLIVKRMHEEGRVQEAKYNALFARCLAVGADDLSAEQNAEPTQ